MKDALIGWTGFVGQELLLNLPNADIYNSKNIDTLCGKEYNYIYFAGLPAEKWKINQNSEVDKENLNSIMEILKCVKCNKFILISTVDIFNCSIQQEEDGQVFAKHPYGIHRRQMEEFIRSYYNSYLIVRLPGLFGTGLKKNIIYDLIFSNNIEQLTLDSEFQYYNVSNLYDDIQKCIRYNYSIVNLVSEPISVRKVVSTFFPQYIENCKGTNIVKYKLGTKYMQLYQSADIIMEQLGTYIDFEKTLLNKEYQIAVSNIAYNDNEWNDIQKLLSRYRIKNIEVAPTKFADWSELSDKKINDLSLRNCKYVSCQSILFNTDIQVFNDSVRFIEHYEFVASICEKMGISIIVFGSPKQRHLTVTEDSAIALFRQVGDISSKYNIKCCIEHNSREYGCTWLTTINDVFTFVKQVHHPNIFINFDTGNYLMELSNSAFTIEMLPFIGHIQVSCPHLSPIDNYDTNIINLLNIIINNGYKNCISLEMREVNMYQLSSSIKILYSMLNIYL